MQTAMRSNVVGSAPASHGRPCRLVVRAVSGGSSSRSDPVGSRPSGGASRGAPMPASAVPATPARPPSSDILSRPSGGASRLAAAGPSTPASRPPSSFLYSRPSGGASRLSVVAMGGGGGGGGAGKGGSGGGGGGSGDEITPEFLAAGWIAFTAAAAGATIVMNSSSAAPTKSCCAGK